MTPGDRPSRSDPPTSDTGRRVAIIGGGIAGLALAGQLHRSGWLVTVHERSTNLPTSGTALGMWPEAMRALDRIGIGAQIRTAGVVQHEAVILTADGAVISHLRDQDVVLVSRPALLRHLAGTVPAHRVERGRTVDDPLGCEADLVVGADGIHSVVRRAGWPHCRPRPLGTIAFRGTVPGPARGVSESWGPGQLFGITPQDDHTTNWFACVRSSLLSEDQLTASPVDVLRRLYGGWHREIRSVLERLDDQDIDRRRLYDLPPLPRYVRGRAALIGDAAHAMAPNLGRGACESLVDAVVLAEALISRPSVADALASYDAARRRPANRILRASRQVNRLSTMTRLTGLRDSALRVVTGRR